MKIVNNSRMNTALTKTTISLSGITLLVSGIRQVHKLSRKNAADQIWKENTWNKWMFVLWNFDEKEDTFNLRLNSINQRLKEFDKTQSWYPNQSGKIIESLDKNAINHILHFRKNTQPSNTYPWIFFSFPKSSTIVALLYHYHFDGLVLFNFIKTVFNIKNQKLSVIKYKYKFPISDIGVIEYTSRQYLKSVNFNPLPKSKKTCLYNVCLERNNSNRWMTLGKVMKRIWKYVKMSNNYSQSKKSLRTALTVAWDDNYKYCKNRIGVIIIDIPYLSTELEYSIFIKENCMKRKNDALMSYDIIRSFPTYYLRKYWNSSLDIILTSF
jgi:hypothetical protein